MEEREGFMRGRLKWVGIFIICLPLLAIPDPVSAISTSFSQAVINLRNLQFSGISITPLSQTSSSSAQASNDVANDSGSQILPGFITSASASVVGASGNSLTTSRTLFESVNVLANGMSPTVSTSANASALRIEQFVADASGDLTIQAPFTLLQTLTTSESLDMATGFASANLGLFNLSSPGFPSDTDQQSLNNTIAGADFFNDSRSGTLSVTLPFNMGQLGSFTALVDNSGTASPIPEPSTILLLGGGVAGLMAWRWNKTNGNKN